MNADPVAQRRLLDLQALDTELAQLEHRRRTLPELAVISDADARLAAVGADVVRAETGLADLAREQRRLEGDVDQVRERSVRDQRRLQASAVPPRELESLQHEVQTLARRQSDLEDLVLDLMERREEAESRLAAVQAEVARVRAAREVAASARDTALGQIDAAVQTRSSERSALAGRIPAELLGLYETVRATAGGVGAAALRQCRCEGCRLELAGAELRAARSAAPETVLRCDNCRRILVRTPESGL